MNPTNHYWVDAPNPVYSSVDGVLFNKSKTMLIQCPGGKAGSYTIPNSVTSVGGSAFAYCSGLASVTISNGVISIGGSAFAYCSSLANVTIPNSVISIGTNAFAYCSSLASVLIGNSVTSIKDRTFWHCIGLTSVSIPNSVSSIGVSAFDSCASLTSLTIPSSVTSIGDYAFYYCGSLTSITIPNSLTSIGWEVFAFCGLTSVTIPNSVTSIGFQAFYHCAGLTRITIPNSVTRIWDYTFQECASLTSVTIPNSVTGMGNNAFAGCTSLTGVYFMGNAPNIGSRVFDGDNNATIYYLPGTTGWYTQFADRPTARWTQVPTIQTSPQTQTVEASSTVGLWVHASSPLPLFYLWNLNSTNLIGCSTNSQLELTNMQFFQSGTYAVVISNVLGAVTSAPVTLKVIAAVERRPAARVKMMGEVGSLLSVDYANSLSPAPNWTPLGSVSLTSTSQYYFDVTMPLPPQRFYRAWQMGTPGVAPSLSMLGFVPAITLTGSIGHSVRLDYINQFGPIDAWATLATVPLTNTSQLYFDVSAPGQPQRLYRVVQVP